MQATGRDARGRKQYLYHPQWQAVQNQAKYDRLIDFADALPRLRNRLRRDIRKRGTPREKVLAAVVLLLEATLIRVGNEEYTRTNESFGLTTLRDRHARVRGSQVKFRFRGKSGIDHAIELSDPRLAKIIKACQDLPGQQLFQYETGDGYRQPVRSNDVNDYLREISGVDFTAKEFRTWAGTVIAACELQKAVLGKKLPDRQRTVRGVIGQVAERLGNTKPICRKYYVHPAVLETYLNGRWPTRSRGLASRPVKLSHAERFTLRLLKSAAGSSKRD